MSRRWPPRRPTESGEFLWLMSLSDLMILLFILFVVLFSFAYKKMKQADVQRMVATLTNRKMPETPVDQIHQKLTKWVADQKLNQQVSVQRTDDGITVDIKDRVLFTSGAFAVNPIAISTIRSLAQTLEKIPAPYKIGIEGHTDDEPIHTKDIQDNWDLSARRALSVFYAMELTPALLTRTFVMAAGEMHPIAPNRSPDGVPLPDNQAKNRRVTLRIF